MLAMLCSQTDRVWSFRAGIFEELGSTVESKERPGKDEVSTVVEVVATLVYLHMDHGSKMSIRIGDSLLMARAESSGVLLAWRERGGNPLLIGSFLDKCCEEAPPRVEVPRVLPVLDEPVSAVGLDTETAVREHASGPELDSRSSVEQVYSDHGLKTETRTPGDKARELVWQRDRRTARVISLVEEGDRRIESVSLGGDYSEPISFEVEYDLAADESDDEILVGQWESTRDSAPPEPRHEQVCWVDFESIIRNISELAERFVGARVVKNYWKFALEPSEDFLIGLVEFDWEEGLVFVEPTSSLVNQEATEVLGVIDRWLERCERVVPEEARVWRRIVGEELNRIWEETPEA